MKDEQLWEQALKMKEEAKREIKRQVSASNSTDLLSAAEQACIDLYMQMHVSVMREQIEPLKKLWSIGQELYLAKRNGR